MMMVKTCLGCGGQRIASLEPTEEEMTITRLGPHRRRLRMPLPMICLDCGSTANNYQMWTPTGGKR